MVNEPYAMVVPAVIVAITGMRSEARIARSAGLTALCGGGREEATRRAIAGALGQGATGLLSFGIAGGLAPGLAAGTVIRADGVTMPDGRLLRPSPLALELSGTRPGGLLGTDRIVADAATKRALHARTGALAVDLETHLVAAAAESAGLPWAAIRAIADPAERSLPAAALVGLRADGAPDLAAVLGALLRRPAQLPALIRIAHDAAAGLAALRRLARVLRGRGECIFE